MDLSGSVFGRWVVIEPSSTKVYTHHHAHLCRCQCGTERIVSTSRLKRNLTLSCGCAATEAAAKQNTRHGYTKHRLAATWRTMKERCSNPNHCGYHRYGGRGIHVCERWLSLKNFVEDNDDLALPGLSIDRINNDLGYSPENCKWSSAEEQMNNRTITVHLDLNGRSQSITRWARELGIADQVLRKRIQAGWSVEKTLTTPLRTHSTRPLCIPKLWRSSNSPPHQSS